MANRYRVWWTASWDATAWTKRALTSWWAGWQAVPTSADDVFLEALSWPITISMDINDWLICNNLTISWSDLTISNIYSCWANVWWNLDIGSTVNVSWELVFFFWYGAGTYITQTIKTWWHTFRGFELRTGWSFWARYELLDDLNIGWTSPTFAWTIWDLDTNWYNITSTVALDFSFPNYKKLYLWDSILDLPSWNLTSAFTEFDEWTSTIKVTGNFSGAAETYNNVELNWSTSIIAWSNTFADLKIGKNWAQTITFTDGTDQTVTTFTCVWAPGKIKTLNGTGSAWRKLSCAAWTIYCDYLNLSYSTAEWGATFNAGVHSVNTIGNSWWTRNTIPQLNLKSFRTITEQWYTTPTGEVTFYSGDNLWTINWSAVAWAAYQWKVCTSLLDYSSTDWNLVWSTWTNALWAISEDITVGTQTLSRRYRRKNTIAPLAPSYTLPIEYLVWSGGFIALDFTWTNNIKNRLSPSVWLWFTGVTYQWQDSPDNSTRSDVVWATWLDYDVGTVDDKFYRRKAIKSGQTDKYSNRVYNSYDGKFEVTFDIKDGLWVTIPNCDLTFDGTVYPTGTTTVRCYDTALNPPHIVDIAYDYTVSKDARTYSSDTLVHGDITVTPLRVDGQNIALTGANPSSWETITLIAYGGYGSPSIVVWYQWSTTEATQWINPAPAVTTDYWCFISYLGWTKSLVRHTQNVT